MKNGVNGRGNYANEMIHLIFLYKATRFTLDDYEDENEEIDSIS